MAGEEPKPSMIPGDLIPDGVDARLAADELPDEEPLTPELVEEEAVRGDFMLRWAVVFLAILFGFSQFSDTRTLVQIRSGDQMRANGFLPPRTESMSFTMNGSPTTNVSWLFDHVVSAAWSAGQSSGLTVFKALMAGVVSYLLVSISVAGIPTWWTSICALFAVVACSGDFVPLPDLATLLGIVMIARLLHQHRCGTVTGLEWKAALVIAIWCNFDSRAWIGSMTMVLYTIGCAFGSRQRPGEDPVLLDSGRPLTAPGLAAVLSVLALLVNPFPLNSLFSSMTLYSVEYPTLKLLKPLTHLSFDGRVDNYSVLNPRAFTAFDHTQIAGLTILLIAFVMLIVARDRRNSGYLTVLCGLSFLVALATHEIPAAAIVAASVAATTAQRWYRSNYSLQYTLDPRELMFSRGGRAFTVLAMAFLGFCVVAGRLPGNTPIGFGFDRDTQITIDTIGTQLADIKEDARILHTRLEQGDILIWHGRKSCVDSRLLPFGRLGDPNAVVAKHKLIRDQILLPQVPSKDEEEQKKQVAARNQALESMEKLNITHMMIRLSPPGEPDYRSIETLFGTPGWLLVNLGASAAFVEKVPTETPPSELIKRFPQFNTMAFRDVEPAPTLRGDFAREPDFYQKHIYRKRPVVDQHLRLARHYLWLSGGSVQSTEDAAMKLSMNMLALRSLNKSLSADPQNSDAWKHLGIAYHQLGIIEGLLSGDTQRSMRQEVRELQSIMALRQSQKSAADPVVVNLLLQKFTDRNSHDLAYECVPETLQHLRTLTPGPEMNEQISNLTKLSEDLQERIAENEKALQEFLKNEKPETEPQARSSQIMRTVASLASGGFRRRALQMLTENANLTRESPEGRILTGQLLLETGDVEQGVQTLLEFSESVLRKQPDVFAQLPWYVPVASCHLVNADYASAIEIWTEQLKQLEKSAGQSAPIIGSLLSMPGAPEAMLVPGKPLPTWPIEHLNALKIPMQGIPSGRAEMRMLIALAHLEEGNVSSAKLILQSIITECGDSPGRNLASVYFSLIETDATPFLKKNSLNQWESFEFTSAEVPIPSTSAAEPQAAQPQPAEPAGDASPSPASPESSPAE